MRADHSGASESWGVGDLASIHPDRCWACPRRVVLKRMPGTWPEQVRRSSSSDGPRTH